VGGDYAILARHAIAVTIVVLGAIERKKAKGKMQVGNEGGKTQRMRKRLVKMMHLKKGNFMTVVLRLPKVKCSV
jgi:hypothetical protein